MLVSLYRLQYVDSGIVPYSVKDWTMVCTRVGLDTLIKFLIRYYCVNFGSSMTQVLLPQECAGPNYPLCPITEATQVSVIFPLPVGSWLLQVLNFTVLVVVLRPRMRYFVGVIFDLGYCGGSCFRDERLCVSKLTLVLWFQNYYIQRMIIYSKHSACCVAIHPPRWSEHTWQISVLWLPLQEIR